MVNSEEKKMNNQFNDDEFKKASACAHCHSCVVVAHQNGVIAVRDTKDRAKTTLSFTTEEWQAFVTGVKNGEFDF